MVIYVVQMVEELIREDGMSVMSAGMGWQKAVAVILRLHMERRRYRVSVLTPLRNIA